MAELVTRIMDHIIDNGYYLIGRTASPPNGYGHLKCLTAHGSRNRDSTRWKSFLICVRLIISRAMTAIWVPITSS